MDSGSLLWLNKISVHSAIYGYTVELRLSELIKTRGGSDKLIVRIIEQHAIHMKLDHITNIVAHC